MNIALLIDADNTQPQKMEAIFNLLAERGNIPVRRAYGNWSKEQLKSWVSVTRKLAIKQEQQPDYVADKNATDMALAIGALDLLHKGGYDIFAIVSSDSDFTPLSIYLREAGAQVLGFGREFTPEAFRASCNEFIFLEPLEPQTTPPNNAESTTAQRKQPQAKTELRQSPAKPVLDIDEPILHDILCKTEGNCQDPLSGYTLLTEVGNYLHSLHPQCKLRYAGHTKLLNFLAAHANRYELKKNSKIVHYRCLRQASAPHQAPTQTTHHEPEQAVSDHPGTAVSATAQAEETTVPARIHLWLRQISEACTTAGNYASMGYTGLHLHRLAREEGTEFNIKLYGYPNLINLIKDFPELYEVAVEERNGTKLYSYKCRHFPQRLG